jgi:putative protein kinase ArgK-like GTPase of G3E family
MAEALEVMFNYETTMRANSALDCRRQGQASDWLRSEITEQLLSRFAANEQAQRIWRELDVLVQRGDLPATGAAQQIVADFLRNAQLDEC